MNIVKQKNKRTGRIEYRARDSKGKHIMFLGTAERIVGLCQLGAEYKKISAQLNELKPEVALKSAQLELI